MPKFFTLAEAEALVPAIEARMLEAAALKAAFEESEEYLENAARRITMMGGSLVNRDLLLSEKNRRQASAARLKEVLDTIHSQGCHVKDLDTGLVDFPTLYRGKEVYLCWKTGERNIVFWHGVDEGFRGRKKIDRNFLEHHQGDPLH